MTNKANTPIPEFPQNAEKIKWENAVNLVREELKAPDNLLTPLYTGDYCLSDEILDRFNDLFYSLFEYYRSLTSLTHIQMLFFNGYILDDKATLRGVGKLNGSSGEFVRQVCSKVKRKYIAVHNKSLKCNDPTVMNILTELADIMNGIGYESILYFMYHQKNGLRKRNLIFEMLFGKEALDNYTKNLHIFNKISHKPTKSALPTKEDLSAQRWETLAEKITYPTQFFTVFNPNTPTIEPNKSFKTIDRFAAYLKGLEPIITTIRNPDIVYYRKNGTDYRPDFLIKASDGRPVLVIVISISGMAYAYNITRFNVFHTFCKKNGYGYLIINERTTSIFEVKSRILSEKLDNELFNILKTNGVITWQDIKQLRGFINIKNLDITTFVLQHKLFFIPQPFSIRLRFDNIENPPIA